MEDFGKFQEVEEEGGVEGVGGGGFEGVRAIMYYGLCRFQKWSHKQKPILDLTHEIKLRFEIVAVNFNF